MMKMLLSAMMLALFLNPGAVAQAAQVPALSEVPASLSQSEHSRLLKLRQKWQGRLAGLKKGIATFNSDCQSVVAGSSDAAN